MENFVTILNSTFLPQGLALNKSLEKNLIKYNLWIICVDDQAFDILTSLNIQFIKPIKLSTFETVELLNAKKSRTIAEYCWTLTPFAPRFVFDTDKSVKRVTYVDADLYFIDDPAPIFSELENSNKKVLITEHAYSPECDQTQISGKYCVQYITYVRDGSEIVREWWEKRCLEWCYARHEDGKYGDQKYLEKWPVLFGELVHVLKNRHFAMGPWNATKYEYSGAIFYHFHGVRLVSQDQLVIGDYLLPEPLYRNVYEPYFNDMFEMVSCLLGFNYQFKKQGNKISILRSAINKSIILIKSIKCYFRANSIYKK